ESYKSSRFHPCPDLRDIYASFTHQSPIIEDIIKWEFPVADVESQQVSPLPTTGNFMLQCTIPPQMIHIDRHSYIVRSNGFSHVIGLIEWVDCGSGVCVHRMQGLNRQFDIQFLCPG